MVFGSWTYDSTGIDFFPEKQDVAKEDFSESEEWTLLGFKVWSLASRVVFTVYVAVTWLAISRSLARE